MGSSGTKQADGIAQTITHLFVHGMVLLVTMTHLTLKQSYVSLGGNRNLSINFKSFVELFSGRRVDFTSRSPSIVNLSFCDIKSPVLANILYLEKMSTCDLKGNKLYGSVPDFYEDFSFFNTF